MQESCKSSVHQSSYDTSHLMTLHTFKRNTLPCLFSKVLSQLGLRETSQISHVLHSQGFCNGGSHLTPQVTAARVTQAIQEYSVLLVIFYLYSQKRSVICIE